MSTDPKQQYALITDPNLLLVALILCGIVGVTRVLRDAAGKGSVLWGLGQIGGSLSAAMLAGLLAQGLTADPAKILAAMLGAAWLGAEVLDQLSKMALWIFPKLTGSNGRPPRPGPPDVGG